MSELITLESLIEQMEELQNRIKSSYEVHAIRGKIEGLKTAENIILQLSRAETSIISPSQATEINRAITRYIGGISAAMEEDEELNKMKEVYGVLLIKVRKLLGKDFGKGRQADLSKIINISVTSIVKYERGVLLPTLKTRNSIYEKIRNFYIESNKEVPPEVEALNI